MHQRNDPNYCPLNDSGHRYFIYKVVEVFEPYDFPLADEMDTVEYLSILPPLYQRKEYAQLGCNCGSTVKKEVEQR